jgi:hypothetical protein
MNQEEQNKQIGQLIAKCWADEGFKQKLLTDTMATLKAEGTELPAGLIVKAVENTDQVFHLIIPAKPTDLSDDDLENVAGGLVSGDGGCMRDGPWHPEFPGQGGGGIPMKLFPNF